MCGSNQDVIIPPPDETKSTPCGRHAPALYSMYMHTASVPRRYMVWGFLHVVHPERLSRGGDFSPREAGRIGLQGLYMAAAGLDTALRSAFYV